MLNKHRRSCHPLESGDAIVKQIAAEAKQVHEEERHRHVEMQAKKVWILMLLLFSFITLC